MSLFEAAKKTRRTILHYLKKFDRKAIAANDEFLERISNSCGGIAGKRVLEVGVDQGGVLISRVMKKYKAKEAIGINLVAHDKVFFDSCKVLKGDIRKTEFADSYFDILISNSVFEHVQNFDVATGEMFRILKPGGYLYSHFGPIWSTSYGHHLWMRHKLKLYNYWNFKLPPYCHLLMTHQEVTEFCRRKTNDEGLSRAIADYVFKSGDQNQLMYEDHEKIIRESKFEVIFFKGYDMVLAGRYITPDFPQLMEKLRDKYPGKNNFLFDGITLLLRKPV